MRKSVISAGYLFIIWIIIVLLLGSVLFLGYKRNTLDLVRLMRSEAETMIEIIDIAAKRGIYSLDQVEFMAAKSLLENARFIEGFASSGSALKETKIKSLSLENGLDCVIITDSVGRVTYSFVNNDEEIDSLLSLPQTKKVINGDSSEEIFGFTEEMNYSDKKWGVVIGRDAGGAVVVSINPDQMLTFRKLVGLGTIFREIGLREGVKYIVLQDSLGIIAASSDVTEMTGINNDSFFMDLPTDETRSRMLRETGVMEVVKLLVVDDINIGIIRVGLSTEVLGRISKSTQRQFNLLFLIAMIAGVLMFVYLILRQNYSVLDTEHARILAEIREMEEEALRTERLASMGRLAGGIAHEIRNPLNSISIITQRLKGEFSPDSEPEEYNKLLTTVNREIGRMSGIVDHFLKFAKPPELKKIEMDIDGMLREVVNLVSEKAKARDIKIDIDSSPGLEGFFDYDALKQAILNIILNSIEAVEKEGLIEIKTRIKPKEINITIWDSGRGVSEDILPRIFDPYFTTKENGNGLGLSEVHRIITAHNGKITITNSHEGGAIVFISLPSGEKST